LYRIPQFQFCFKNSLKKRLAVGAVFAFSGAMVKLLFWVRVSLKSGVVFRILLTKARVSVSGYG